MINFFASVVRILHEVFSDGELIMWISFAVYPPLGLFVYLHRKKKGMPAWKKGTMWVAAFLAYTLLQQLTRGL